MFASLESTVKSKSENFDHTDTRRVIRAAQDGRIGAGQNTSQDRGFRCVLGWDFAVNDFQAVRRVLR